MINQSCPDVVIFYQQTKNNIDSTLIYNISKYPVTTMLRVTTRTANINVSAAEITSGVDVGKIIVNKLRQNMEHKCHQEHYILAINNIISKSAPKICNDSGDGSCNISVVYSSQNLVVSHGDIFFAKVFNVFVDSKFMCTSEHIDMPCTEPTPMFRGEREHHLAFIGKFIPVIVRNVYYKSDHKIVAQISLFTTPQQYTYSWSTDEITDEQHNAITEMLASMQQPSKNANKCLEAIMRKQPAGANQPAVDYVAMALKSKSPPTTGTVIYDNNPRSPNITSTNQPAVSTCNYGLVLMQICERIVMANKFVCSLDQVKFEDNAYVWKHY